MKMAISLLFIKHKKLVGMRKNKYNDLPFVECVDKADELIAKGGIVFQKFTCLHCGQRLTMGKPNTFYKEGTCDKCGETTKIDKCGFILMISNVPDDMLNFMQDLANKIDKEDKR